MTVKCRLHGTVACRRVRDVPRDLAQVEEDHTPRVSGNQNDHDAQDIHHETALHLQKEYIDK